MSDCKAYLREIECAADGFATSEGARAHAEGCRDCGRALRDGEALRRLVRGLGTVEAPADFEFRLRARMASAKPGGGRGLFARLRPGYRLAPVAVAACFLFVSASLYIWQSARLQRGAPQGGAAQQAATGTVGVQRRETPVASLAEVSTPLPAAPFVKTAGTPAQLSRRTEQRAHAAAARRLPVPTQRSVAVAANSGVRSTDASLNPAEVIRPRTLSIPLETASAPLRLVLRDERGGQRVVPVRAVSFGAQDLIGRDAARRQTTEANDEGVW